MPATRTELANLIAHHEAYLARKPIFRISWRDRLRERYERALPVLRWMMRYGAH